LSTKTPVWLNFEILPQLCPGGILWKVRPLAGWEAKRMLEILTRITEGKGKMEDIDTIRASPKGCRPDPFAPSGQLTRDPSCPALQYSLSLRTF